MNSIAQDLRSHLESRDFSGFLDAFEAVSRSSERPPAVTAVTQRILPPLLIAGLRAGNLSADDLIRIWRLIRSSQLLIIDNDILTEINNRIGAAWVEVEGPDTDLPEPLMTFSTAAAEGAQPARPVCSSSTDGAAIALKRIVVRSAFTVGLVSSTDSLSLKKNVCASSQEREFLKALRQYFPNLQAYPNVPLRNFMDVDSGMARLSDRHRSFAWASQVDVLLCTEDEDPVVGFELDSLHHDAEEAGERDQLKNELFTTAGIPLVRIRPANTRDVRAEDFYDLLVAEECTLDKLRPRRLRPRRTHDVLVPA
ncbi:MAG: DUF2726 domain-containing protein [Sterolibacterium sp.]|jgi:hypothetical protein